MEILLVDDDADVRDALCHVLGRAGFSVRSAGNGADAIAALRKSGADIVITDIIMPLLDGVETIHAIREEFPNIRIIAISGGGNVGAGEFQPQAITTSAYLAAASKFGADAILAKPFETAELLIVIQQLSATGRA